MNKDAPRDGSGPLVEVYPAAALALWGLDFTKYKGAGEGAREARRRMVDRLEVGRSVAGKQIDAVIASAHVLDAFVCALIARDADVCGMQIPEANRVDARFEGWIHLPEAPLSYA